MSGVLKWSAGVALFAAIAGIIWWGRTDVAAPPAKPLVHVVTTARVPHATERPVTVAPVSVPPPASASPADSRPDAWDRVTRDIAPLLTSAPLEMREEQERLTRERRDEAWAPQAETTLRASYTAIKGIGDAGRTVDIRCGATVCIVSSSLANLPHGKGDDVMAAVQAPRLIEDMAAKGFQSGGSLFGPGAKTRDMFVSYWVRAKPEVIKL